MNPTLPGDASRRGDDVTRCSVAIHRSIRAIGSVTLPIADVEAKRKQLTAAAKDSHALTAARFCDDQSILGIMAMLDAASRGGFAIDSTSMWNLIAAPRHAGRTGTLVTVKRFFKLGPSGVSPLLIPFSSLHAIASTLSVYFGIHGPTYGVSGCCESISEILVTGFTTPINEMTPGTWLVVTEWDPDVTPDENGKPVSNSMGYGVALAIEDTSASLPIRVTFEIFGDAAEQPVLDSVRLFADAVSRIASESATVYPCAGGRLTLQHDRGGHDENEVRA
jgi:hypothetical protein